MVIVNLVTFAWLTWWAVLAIRQLAAGNKDSVLYVMLVFYVYCGVPLALDIALGIPDYRPQPGFKLAVFDEQTSVIYCAFVASVPLIWHRWGRITRDSDQVTPESLSGINVSGVERLLARARPVFQVLAWLPLLSLFYAPNPGDYREYGAGPVKLLESSTELQFGASYYIGVVSRVSLLAVVAIGALMLTQRRHFLYNLVLYFVPLLAAAVWLQGKRTSMVLAAVILLFVLWYRGYLRGGKLYVAGATAVLLLAVFSNYYQSDVRSVYDESSDPARVYRGARIDYGRDSRIKMAIFAELNPDEMQILDYRGQSLVYYSGLAIPREIWSEKPLPYAQYFTAAMQLRPAEMRHGGMSTSWLDEAIANFGWFGFVPGVSRQGTP